MATMTAATSSSPSDKANNKTHYQVFGVASSSTYEEIKTVFHRLARKHHPDKQQIQSLSNPHEPQVDHEDDSSTTFKRIQVAWECLRDSSKRKSYDQDLNVKQSAQIRHDTAALEIFLNDLEEAVDDETGERAHVYVCRCGGELQIWESDWETTSESGSSLLVDCPGCCFVYRVCRS
jgi:DnaJ-class molecular chaperone